MSDATSEATREDAPGGVNRTAIALVLFFGALIAFNVIFFATAFSTPPDVLVQPDTPAQTTAPEQP